MRRAVERAASAVLFGVAVGVVVARSRRLVDRGSERTQGDEEIPDPVLIARVRDEAAVPEGVEVTMTDGAVVLFGRVMRSALVPLLQRVASIEGVAAIENRLTPVDMPFERPPA